MQQFFWLFELFYSITNIVVKQSIVLMLLRYVLDDFQKKLIYIITGTANLCSIMVFFFVIFQCLPVSYYWTKALPGTEGRCVEWYGFFIIGAGYSFANLSFYGMTAIIPYFIVRKMQLDLQTKVMLALVLGLGSM